MSTLFALKQFAEKGAGLVALVDIQPGEDGREGPTFWVISKIMLPPPNFVLASN